MNREIKLLFTLLSTQKLALGKLQLPLDRC